MRKIRALFLKSEHFFSIFKKGQGKPPPPPYLRAFLPYNKSKKQKKKNASGNACLKGTGTVPATYRKKHCLKKNLVWNLSAFLSFFFQLYTNETLHRYFSRILATYTVGTFTEQLFSGTAILTEHFQWLLLGVQKFSNYHLKA